MKELLALPHLAPVLFEVHGAGEVVFHLGRSIFLGGGVGRVTHAHLRGLVLAHGVASVQVVQALHLQHLFLLLKELLNGIEVEVLGVRRVLAHLVALFVEHADEDVLIELLAQLKDLLDGAPPFVVKVRVFLTGDSLIFFWNAWLFSLDQLH